MFAERLGGIGQNEEEALAVELPLPEQAHEQAQAGIGVIESPQEFFLLRIAGKVEGGRLESRRDFERMVVGHRE
jgi:hypothetical protein